MSARARTVGTSPLVPAPAWAGLLMTATTPVPPIRFGSRPSAVSSCSIRSAVACSAMLSSGWLWKWR